mmetsp:Transcript_28781/g.69712  ORF Transcript_28781/g.69712 Transcript_28781/m.69712 type:complete len:470 (+) Transcript_28781:147-1556(+)
MSMPRKTEGTVDEEDEHEEAKDHDVEIRTIEDRQQTHSRAEESNADAAAADDGDDDGDVGGVVNQVIEHVLRIIFCLPKEDRVEEEEEWEEEDDQGLTELEQQQHSITGRIRIFELNHHHRQQRRKLRAFHIIAHAFHVLELVDFIMDFVFVLTRLFPAGNYAEGSIVICGMVIAWTVSYYGQRQLQKGGIKYTPYGIPFDKFYRHMPARRKIHPLLYTISFTELAAFFFEDGVFIASIQSLDLYDTQDGTFDRFILWLTLLKSLSAGLFAACTFIATINCNYCSEQKLCLDCYCCCKDHSDADGDDGITETMEQHNCCSMCKKCGVGCCSFLPVLYLFIVWLVGILDTSWVLEENERLYDFEATNNDDDASENDEDTFYFTMSFLGRTAIYWLGGLYCVFCLIRYRRKKEISSSPPSRNIGARCVSEAIAQNEIDTAGERSTGQISTVAADDENVQTNEQQDTVDAGM